MQVMLQDGGTNEEADCRSSHGPIVVEEHEE